MFFIQIINDIIQKPIHRHFCCQFPTSPNISMKWWVVFLLMCISLLMCKLLAQATTLFNHHIEMPPFLSFYKNTSHNLLYLHLEPVALNLPFFQLFCCQFHLVCNIGISCVRQIQLPKSFVPNDMIIPFIKRIYIILVFPKGSIVSSHLL